ncbi:MULTISPECIES: hypothetical protein [unclassified Streptomyces]|uniref:hypothetical protein n=1 Tax=unclassified Streptomyces TaxID=2593676 RepID=UPI0036462192
MHDSPRPEAARTKQAISTRLRGWIKRRYRTALGLALRGACYGAGTAAATATTYWLQHRP